MRYWISNGFHNTTTFVLVAPRVGARVSAKTMRRAGRALCGMSDCMCGSSNASSPREGQLSGFEAAEYRHLGLVPESGDDWIIESAH